MSDDWVRDPETLERIFHAALRGGDAQGVDAALRLMTVADPGRAVALEATLRLALTADARSAVCPACREPLTEVSELGWRCAACRTYGVPEDLDLTAAPS